MMNERKGVIPKGACTNETKGPMQGAAQEEQFIRWIFWIVLLTLIPWIVIRFIQWIALFNIRTTGASSPPMML